MTKLDPNRWFFRSGPQCPEHCFSLGTIAPPCPSCLFYLQSDKRAPPGFGSQAAVVDAILSGPRPLANAENALCAAPAALPRLLVRGADGEAPCAADVVGRVGRAVQQVGDESVAVRRAALQQVHDSFCCSEWREALPEPALAAAFGELAKPLFRRLGDAHEKCRELTVAILAHFLSRCKNLNSHMAYLWPAVMRRLADAHGYDPETNVCHPSLPHAACQANESKPKDCPRASSPSHTLCY